MEKKEVQYKNDFYRSPDFLTKVQWLANSKGYDDMLKTYDISGKKKEVTLDESYFIDQIYHERENWKLKNIQTLFFGLSDLFNAINRELLIYNDISNDKILLEYLTWSLSLYTKLWSHFPKVQELLSVLQSNDGMSLSTAWELAWYINNMYPRLWLFDQKKPTWYFMKNEEIFAEARSMLFLFEHLKAALSLYNYNFYELFPKLRQSLTFDELGQVWDWLKEMQLVKMKEIVTSKMNASIANFITQFKKFHLHILDEYFENNELEKSFTAEEIKTIDALFVDVDRASISFDISWSFRFKDDVSILRKVVQKKIPLRDLYDWTWTLFITDIPFLKSMIQKTEWDAKTCNLLKKLHAVLTKEIISPKIIEYIPSIVGTDFFLKDRLKNYLLIQKNTSNEDFSSLQLWFWSFILDNKLFEIPHEVIVSTWYTDHDTMRKRQYTKTMENYLSKMNVQELYEYLLRHILSTDALGYLHKSKRDTVLLTSKKIQEFKKKWAFQQNFDIREIIINELLQMDRWTFSKVLHPERIELYTKTIFGKDKFWKNQSSEEYKDHLDAFAEKLSDKFATKILQPLESKLLHTDIKKHAAVVQLQQRLFQVLSEK